MAEFTPKPTMVFTGTFTLDEDQLRALSHIASYGHPAIVEALDAKVGGLITHAPALKRFLLAVQDQVDPQLAVIDTARRDLHAASRKRQEQADADRRARLAAELDRATASAPA